MRSAAWIALGLVFGLAVGAAAQREYNYYYDADAIRSASDGVQKGYAAGVFDLLETLVEGKDKGFIYTGPRELAKAYDCMDHAASTIKTLAKWARGYWLVSENRQHVAADVMIAAGSKFCRR